MKEVSLNFEEYTVLAPCYKMYVNMEKLEKAIEMNDMGIDGIINSITCKMHTDCEELLYNCKIYLAVEQLLENALQGFSETMRLKNGIELRSIILKDKCTLQITIYKEESRCRYIYKDLN
jgi:hypothetical protein